MNVLQKSGLEFISFILVLATIPADARAQAASTSGYPIEYAPLAPDELDTLIDPIALYPESLVAQVLGNFRPPTYPPATRPHYPPNRPPQITSLDLPPTPPGKTVPPDPLIRRTVRIQLQPAARRNTFSLQAQDGDASSSSEFERVPQLSTPTDVEYCTHTNRKTECTLQEESKTSDFVRPGPELPIEPLSAFPTGRSQT
jgi:hypothetical protein